MSDDQKSVEARVRVLEGVVKGLKTTVVENGRVVNAKLSDTQLAFLKLDKKLDRVLTVTMQTATELNLHRRRDIHLEDACHPAQKIEDHLQWHKAQKVTTDNTLESRWKRVGILAAVLAGVTGAVLGVWNFITTHLGGGGVAP